MKNLILITAILLISLNAVKAQTPTWLWAKNESSPLQNRSFALSTDNSGSVYVLSMFNGPVATGTGSITSPYDFFLFKYDSTGKVIWIKNAQTTAAFNYTTGSTPGSIHTDAQGNIFIAGRYFGDSFSFGGVTITDTNTIEYDNSHIFLLKCDPSGNTIWIKNADGGSNSDENVSLSIDASGNAYISGGFHDSMLIIGQDTLMNSNTDYSANIFLAKYNSSGQLLWAKNGYGFNNTYIDREDDAKSTISVDAGGNIYMACGFTWEHMVFGTDTLKNSSYSTDYQMAIKIIKFDPSGNIIWMRNTGAAYSLPSETVINTDASDNVYVTGAFRSHTISFGDITLTNTGMFDNFFIAKYDQAGNVLWATNSGGTGEARGVGISPDAFGNIYVIGNFNASSITLGDNTLPFEGGVEGENFFVAKYDSMGRVLWVGNFGDAMELTNYSTGICGDASGNIYVTGEFNDATITFGNTVLMNPAEDGGLTLFLAKLSSNGIAHAEAVDENTRPGLIKAYPNPSDGNIYFTGIKDNYTIEIYNMFGERVYSSLPGLYWLNLSEKAKGVYFYRVMNENTLVQSGKVVTQ